MESKRSKINLILVIVSLVIFVIGSSSYYLFSKYKENKELEGRLILDTVRVKSYENEDYYIIEGDYKGEYDLQVISLSQYDSTYIKEEFSKSTVMDYSEYKEYCNKWGLVQEYMDVNNTYIVFSYVAYGISDIEVRLAGVEYKDSDVNLYIWDEDYDSYYGSIVIDDISAYSIVIPTDREVNDINIVDLYSEDEFEYIKEYDISYPMIDKPIIYLYPTKEMEVFVKLGNKDRLTTTYPKYIDGWKVLAKPNGDLLDLKTGRYLYSLYYESKSIEEFKVLKEGFVVKEEDSIKFLEEKLSILGLTEREIEEFIIYWLPKLESNKYNYIRFANREEINNNMPLEISPSPDTIIRVLMVFKGLDKEIDVIEQELTTPKRDGFTVVEWGGTEIK